MTDLSCSWLERGAVSDKNHCQRGVLSPGSRVQWRKAFRVHRVDVRFELEQSERACSLAVSDSVIQGHVAFSVDFLQPGFAFDQSLKHVCVSQLRGDDQWRAFRGPLGE